MSIVDSSIDIAFGIVPDEAWTPTTPAVSRRLAEMFVVDPAVGSGAAIAHAVKAAPHGIVDDGYAEGDDTSRWIERMERPHV